MSERPSPHEHGRRRRRAVTWALWCGVGLGLAAVQPAPESEERQPASALTSPRTSPRLELAEVRQRVQALRQALAAGQPVSTAARQLLGAVEAVQGPFSLEAAAVLDLLVECGWRSGAATAPETQALAERALRIHLVLADDADLAESLRSTGILFEFCNRLTEAAELYNVARDLLARCLGPQAPEVAMLGNDIAIVSTRMGKFAAAIDEYRRALATLEAAPAAEPLDIAFVLNGLAIALGEEGEYTGAREAHERALTLRTRHLPPDHPKIAESLNNLGAVLSSMGDGEQALELFERVLAMRRQAYGDRHPLTAAAMVNVARQRLESGDFAGAERFYGEARAIVAPTDPSLVSCYVGLGLLHQKTGDPVAAAADYEQVRRLAAELLDPEHPYIGEALHQLATLRYEAGDLAAARALVTEALARRERSLGAEHPEVAQSLVLLAAVLAESGDTAGAFRASAEAEARGRAHLESASRALAEREALLLAGIRARGLDLMQGLAVRASASPALVPTVWDAVLRARALVFEEMLQRNATRALHADAELSRLAQEYQDASTHFANLAFRSTGNGGASLQERIRQAARAREVAERALATRSQDFRAWQARRDLGLDAVARSLPAGEALVAYSVYRRQERVATGLQPVRELVAFVLAGAQPPRLLALGPMQHVDSLVARWGFEAAVGVGVRGRTAAQSETAYRRAGEALRRAVWDPLEPYVAGASHVLVVPDGALHLLNIAALPRGEAERAADGYLADAGVRVHTLASERDLLPLRQAPAGHGLLALGGADFDGQSDRTESEVSLLLASDASDLALRDSPCAALESLHFVPLPGTAREVGDVARLWGAGSTVLTGPAASDVAFKRAAPGKRVLHLATHGFFLGACAPAAAGTRSIQLHKLPLESAVPRPPDLLLQSGLALAGANRRAAAPPGSEDGILTAAEIAALDLQGVEWAVLSACNTGLGEVRVGEGVLGLCRAFQVAGARSVIMSLWPVADEPTRAWMRALYEARLRQHQGTADAVHHADVAILAARRSRGQSTHPFYWAAFVSSGDWR